MALFRIVQECLTNIHRHSGRKSAAIRMTRDNGSLIVQVTDHGKGIAKEKLPSLASGRTGVGIGGMRERLKQMGGTLDIRSSEDGTLVTAILNANGRGTALEPPTRVPTFAQAKAEIGIGALKTPQ